MDDAYRYDALITRNPKGENTGAKPSPPLLAFSAGLLAMRARPVPDLFTVAGDRDPHPEKKYAAEFAIFERNIAG